MKRLKLKSPKDYQAMPKMLRSSSKKARQKNSVSNNSALNASSSPTSVPQLPPSPRASFEDTMKVNLPSVSFYSVKDLSPDPNIKRIEEPEVSKKTPLSISPKKNDSEVPWKQVKPEEVSPGVARKKHPKLSYLESSKREWQRPEVMCLEHNFNDETNCNNNGSNRSTVVIKQEYDLIPPLQSVPIKKSHSNPTFCNSDIYSANSTVLNSTVSKITDHSSTSLDLRKPTSQKSSSYQQNNNALHTSWSSDGKLQETNSKKIESLSTQTQYNSGQQPSQTPLGCQESAVRNNQNLEVPNYMHEDSCLSLLLSEDHEQNMRHEMEAVGESLPELVPSPHPIRNSLLPIQTHPSQGYNYFTPSQHLGPKQDYLNLGPPKTGHDLQPWMTMGLPGPQQPNVSSYLCPGPQIPYGSSMAPYPQQPSPHSSAMCWNQNLPVYEGGMIPGPMTQFSDGNLMPAHLMKNQSQGCYFVHSMLPSSSAPFSFLPNQNPSQMEPTLSNMSLKAPSKGTMIRIPMIRLPEMSSAEQNFISAAGKSAFSKSPSSEWHDFNSGNNEDCSQETQLLDKNAKLVDHNRTEELFGIFQDFQIPKSISGATKGQFILRKYIDFLILENEGITEMSQAYTPSTPLFSLEEDQYILEAATDNTLFPTSKFERFIQIHFPSIDLHRIDFGECKGSDYMPQKVDTDMDKIRDVFFYFQTLRGTKSNMMDAAISDTESVVI